MNNTGVGKARVLVMRDIIENVPNEVVIKTIIKNPTGNINMVSCDMGEVLTLKTIPFDNFVQIIDGKAEIIIDGTSNLLDTGQSIIIPAHTSNTVKANERLKMISTIIKSGYEDIS